MDLKKNDCIELEFTAMTSQGQAIGHYSPAPGLGKGIAVFVPLAAPGDRGLVRIVKVGKTFCYGKLEKILAPSPHRVQPDCPCFAQCGGCCYRHITYEEELRVKWQRVQDALERVGGFPQLPLRPILGASSRNGYRNKALLPLGAGPGGRLAMGFYAVNSHRIVDCQACQLHPPVFNQAMEAFRLWAKTYGDAPYDEFSHTGVMRRLYLRMGARTGQVMACVVVNGRGLSHEKELIDYLRQAMPGLSTVVINSNRDRTNVALGKGLRTLYGPGYIEDELCGLRFCISPLSFYQVNPAQAQRLYEKAGEYAGLTGSETLLDLYCGTGTIGLSMAARAGQVVGVEAVPQAVENAWENARRNGIGNAEFICADAAQAAAQLAQRGQRPQVVILDPPRKGVSGSLVETVAAMGPQRVVYVSCDPATLARDLKAFSGQGFAPVEATPVDMFPGTAHVETVVLLSKLRAEHHIEVDLDLGEMDLTSAESKATYEEIKAYVLEKFGLKVSHLYISQVKRKCGLEVGPNYNLPKSEGQRVPQCPPEKEKAIMAALEHFQMIEGSDS